MGAKISTRFIMNFATKSIINEVRKSYISVFRGRKKSYRLVNNNV